MESSPGNCPLASPVTVSRLSETRWTLEAFSTDIACLGSRGGATHGHYFMPFRLTMTAQD